MVREKSVRIGMSGREGYEKLMFRKSMRPATVFGLLPSCDVESMPGSVEMTYGFKKRMGCTWRDRAGVARSSVCATC